MEDEVMLPSQLDRKSSIQQQRKLLNPRFYCFLFSLEKTMVLNAELHSHIHASLLQVGEGIV